MLFRIKPVYTSMVYLNDVLGHFIVNAVRLDQYRKKNLFFEEFLAVHDDGRNSIDSKFRAVFNQIKQLDPVLKKRLKRMYVNHQRIARLCHGDVGIIELSSFPEPFKKPLKELGVYLYKSALNNTRVKNIAIEKYGDINSTMYDLWSAFRDKNGKVCCFCGIQEYEEQLPEESKTKWRPAFDHYLPKERYPLAAVNFRNLVPCCYQCNSKAKGSEDPCNCERMGRRKTLYPYGNAKRLGLKFEFLKENVASNSPWVVSLEDEDDEKHQSWDRVYNIKDRVESRLNYNYVNWIKVDCNECLNSSTKKAREILQKKAVENLKQAKQLRDGIHKARMMATLAASNDSFLESVLDSIEPDPQPGTLEEGRMLLNELGFDFPVAICN